MLDLIRRSRVSRRAVQASRSVSEMIRAAADRPSEKRKTRRFVILDDMYPNLLSGFRLAEFNSYLEYLEWAEIHCTGERVRFGRGATCLTDAMRRYRSAYPTHGKQVRRFNPRLELNSALFYFLFVYNIDTFLPYIERHSAGFVFTLNPGGGFSLTGSSKSEERLRRAFDSEHFRAVIATQHATVDYLTDRQLCPPQKIKFIWGCAFPPDEVRATSPPATGYLRGRDTLNLCFIAHKYMPHGRDKGFDVFIESAKHIARAIPAAHFHVIGDFGPVDWDISGLADRIIFHGPQPHSFVVAMARQMDAIISPNAPFLLGDGAFDGFPTAACTDAGLAGAAVFACDELKENRYFDCGGEIIVLPRDALGIAELVVSFANDPDRLLELRRQCQKAFVRIYSFENQLVPRINLFEKLVNE